MRRFGAVLAWLMLGTLFLPVGAAGSTPDSVTAAPPGGSGAWSHRSTWGGTPPLEGQKVVIPRGVTVRLDTSPPALAALHVDGTLELAPVDVRLRTGYLMIHGTMTAGSTGAPFTNNLSITLTGADRELDVMGMGNRAIGVMGGTLRLIGEDRDDWVRLAATATAGSDTIEVDREVDWRPGEKIAIASTDFWPLHAEERTIVAVDGSTVHLDRSLRYAHFGRVQSIAGRRLDERAEVALLSRNISIRGASDTATDGFGAHLMVMDGKLALDGVEFDRVGQRARLRRYPIHFHMDGDASGSYVKGSAISHSTNRCITIHGTQGVTLQDNVCFDHEGHGFFLEDGNETDNVLRGNLGFATRTPEVRLIPSDEDPATFWITNPDNIVEENAAAGSEGTGFWYALPENPTGLSTGSMVWPRTTPLGSFKNNVAHSNYTGLNVDDGPDPDGTTHATSYEPRVEPDDPKSAPVVARFIGLTAFKNRDRGVWLRGENLVVTRSVLADNRAGATFASSKTYLKRSFVVGESANGGTPESWEKRGPGGRELPFFWEPDAPIHGFEFYDGKVGVVRTRFANFTSNTTRPAGALGYLEENAFAIHTGNFARAVSFFDSQRVHLASPIPGMDGDMAKVFIDKDGSVTGTPGRAVVVDNPFLVDQSCTPRPEWNAHECQPGFVSLMIGTLDDDPGDIEPVTLERADATKQELVGCCDDSTGAWATVRPGQTYAVRFAAETTEGARLILRDAPDDHVIVTLAAATPVKVTRWGWPVAEVSSVSRLRSASRSAWFHDAAADRVYVRIAGEDSAWNEIKIEPR